MNKRRIYIYKTAEERKLRYQELANKILLQEAL
jgi:hypothetical protein